MLIVYTVVPSIIAGLVGVIGFYLYKSRVAAR
jgi:hypothetical protein